MPNLLKSLFKVLDGKFNKRRGEPFTHLTWDCDEIIVWDDDKAFPICAFTQGRLKSKLIKIENKLRKNAYPSFMLKKEAQEKCPTTDIS